MIIDKGYYDYEYQNKPKLTNPNEISDEEAKNLFANFGIGTNTNEKQE